MTTSLVWPPGPSDPAEVAPGVVHVLAPNAGPWTAEGTNTWLVGAQGVCVVVDPGDAGSRHLRSICEAASRNAWRVAAVLMTHDHHDHRDGCTELAAATGAPIYSVRHGRPLPGVLDADGLSIEVLRTPGHSDDSVSFAIPELGVLLTGDTIVGRRSSAVMGSLGDYFSSLALLRRAVAAGDPVVLPGHGPVVDDPSAVIDKVESVRRSRVAEVARLVDRGELRVDELVERVHPGLIDSRQHAARAAVLSCLRHIAETRGVPEFWR